MTFVPRGETRRAERVVRRIPITLFVAPEGIATAKEATTADVSLHGAKILTEAALAPGETVRLVSYEGGGKPTYARVVWVSVEPAQPTQAGLEFLN